MNIHYSIMSTNTEPYFPSLGHNFQRPTLDNLISRQIKLDSKELELSTLARLGFKVEAQVAITDFKNLRSSLS